MAQNIFRNTIAREAIKVPKFESSQIHANESYGAKNHQYIFNKMLTNGSAYWITISNILKFHNILSVARSHKSAEILVALNWRQ